MFLSSPPPTYASERLDVQLSSLSSLPVHLPSNLTASSSTSAREINSMTNHDLDRALQDLSSSKAPTRARLETILDDLVTSQRRRRNVTSTSSSEGGYGAVNEILQAEIIARAVTILWKEVLEELMNAALRLESERSWWDSVHNSQRGIGIYFVQTLPVRIYRAVPPSSTFSLNTLTSLQSSALFPKSPSVAIATLLSPFTLTRREVYSNLKSCISARDAIAGRIGILASQSPKWTADEIALGDTGIQEESDRVYSILCQVLETGQSSQSGLQAPSGGKLKRSRSDTITPPSIPSPPKTDTFDTADLPALLGLLRNDIPKSSDRMDRLIENYKRPGPLTRLWFGLLFLPPAAYLAVSAVVRNKEWMAEQISNAKETAKGFIIQWVWEPLEDIAKTIRGGGEGLGVAPTTVQSDQASLERMVMDLGRDYYHLSGPALEELGTEVKKGDMQAVLRVYEKELQSPVKNALLGSLVRTLLIQVQKTKTDLSLSLLSLDHLLRSQQLTFAFVGVAPSVLILYGLGGWLRNVWRGERRGKGRKKAYFYGLRDIERLLLIAPKKEDKMSATDRGLLIVAVSGLRSWAVGLNTTSRNAFLDDLRLVEDPSLSRGDKLRAVERIWRSWGTDGRRKV